MQQLAPKWPVIRPSPLCQSAAGDSLAVALVTLLGTALGLGVQLRPSNPRRACILPRVLVRACGCGGRWARTVPTIAAPSSARLKGGRGG